MTRRGPLARGIVALALIAAGSAAPAAAVAEAPSQVLLAVQGAASDADGLAASLQELLRRVGLGLSIEPGAVAGRGGASFAMVIADFTADRGASVVVQEGRDGTIRLVRQLDQHGSRALLIDTAAHVAYAVLETMLREAREGAVGGPRAPASPVETDAAALSVAARDATAADPAWGIEISPFYSVRGLALASERTSMSAGVGIGGGWRHGRLQPSLWITSEYGLDTSLASQGSGAPPNAQLQLTSFRLIPLINVAGGARLLLQAGLRFGLDVTTVNGLFAIPPMRPMGPGPGYGGPPMVTTSRLYEPLAGAILMTRVRVAQSTQLFAAVSCDYGPAHVAGFDASSMALQTPHWRPAASLGLAVTLGGAAPQRR
jgi:hypothetical protein